MSRIYLSAICLSLLSIFVSLGATAQEATTTEQKRVIITTPTPKATCKTVEGHWQGSSWIASHDVCKYENRKEGVSWVNSYWSCTDAGTDGTCTNWTLVPGYWTQTFE